MITFLHGVLVDKQPTRAVLDVGGVGYEVFTPLTTFEQLPGVGETCRVLTFDYVREDARQLFGFCSDDERDMFLLLLGASGVGPKLALSALSSLGVRELKAAVATGDVARLSSISGVGKRTAERLVVELRDKIPPEAAIAATSGAEDGHARDAMLALVSLGHKPEAARKMVSRALEQVDAAATPDVEQLIKLALST